MKNIICILFLLPGTLAAQKIVEKTFSYAGKQSVKLDLHISDSIGIQNYLLKEYNVKSEFIAYGAILFDNPDSDVLKKYDLKRVTEVCSV